MVAIFAVAACGLAYGRATQEAAPQTPATIAAASDRPAPGGKVTRRCGSHYAEDFDPGLQTRIVAVGPVSLVAFRVSPVPTGDSPVRTFKVMIRLTAGAEATLQTTTAGTALNYDRATFREDNIYRLSDGDRSVRFTGCPSRAAVFNGEILTSGPRTVDLEILLEGKQIPATVTAFTD